MLERNNVLILDEPTNHLDIDSKEMLEQALSQFQGTILFVSHDRYFINQLANKVLNIDESGGQLYLGDYQYFLDKVEEQQALAQHQATNDSATEQHDTTTNNYTSQKEQKKLQRQITRQIEQCEQDIETYEAQIDDIDVQLTQPEVYSDPEKANALAIEKQQTEQQLEQALELWEELQEK